MEIALIGGNREHIYYDALAHKYRFHFKSFLSIVSRFVSFPYLCSAARARSWELHSIGRLLPSTRSTIDFGSNISALRLNQRTLFSLVCRIITVIVAFVIRFAQNRSFHWFLEQTKTLVSNHLFNFTAQRPPRLNESRRKHYKLSP